MESDVPFPHIDTRLACQSNPEWFSHEHSTNTDARRDVARAKRACSGCPVVEGCLKWALTHTSETKIGVWAATTSFERAGLRRRLAKRLGPHWAAVIAHRDQAVRERQQHQRLNPPTVREQELARLELEAVPRRPEPYQPLRCPTSPAQQQRNVARLLAGLNEQAA